MGDTSPGPGEAPPQRLRFGEFILDVAGRQLFRDGEGIPLSPKAFNVLTLLAHHPGEVISKDRLLDEIWADVTVLEGVVKVTIAEVRRALGETAARPLHLHTAHRLGYRFEGPVTACEQAPATTAPTPAVRAEPAPGGRSCHRCGAALAASAEFCSACGERRADASAASSRAAGAPRAETPGSQPLTRPEIRQISILACALPAESLAALEPEAAEALRNAFRRTVSAIVRSLGGRSVSDTGEGLRFHFGYPISHEDDAHRCARAALRLREQIPELGPRLARKIASLEGVPIEGRIAIHTGPVVVGESATGSAGGEQDETSRLVSALEQLAKPGSILASASARSALRSRFALRDAGEGTVDGEADALQLFELVEAAPDAESVQGTALPMFGRDQEVGRLLDAWGRVQQGRGQGVLVAAEAGMGKSRLLHALRDRLGDTPHVWLDLRASAFHRNTAFHPVVTLLRTALQLGPDEPPEEQVAQIEASLEEAGLPVVETLPHFTQLLSLPLPIDHRPLQLSPELHRRRTLEAMCAWLLSLSEQQPLVLAVEDLHWADPSTSELLGMFMDQLPDARILALVTTRPGYEQAWTARTHLSVIPLDPLASSEAEQVMLSVTDGMSLPIGVRRHIIDKSDGVPLFIEELTRSAIESNLLEQVEGRYERTDPLPPLAIPSTLTGSLEARLDRLGVGREVAQLGAVLGREFTYELIHAVSPLSSAVLDEALDELVGSGLLQRRGITPQATYTFKHALIQETAYQSLLESTRRAYHARVAASLEESRLGDLEPEAVGRHHEGAGDPIRAIASFERAARRAAERSAAVEAAAHFRHALHLLEAVADDGAREQLEVGLQVGLGDALTSTLGYGSEEVEAAYERARSLAQQRGDDAQLSDSIGGLATFYLSQCRLDNVMEMADLQNAMAERLDLPEESIRAVYSTARVRFFRGEIPKALEEFDKTCSRIHELGASSLTTVAGEHPAVFAPAWSAWAHWVGGFPDRAVTLAEEAVETAHALAHPFNVAIALTWSAVMLGNRRDHEAAIAHADAAIEISEQQGFPTALGVSRLQRLRSRADDRADEEVIAEGEAILGELAATGNLVAVPQILGGMGEFCVECGQPDRAMGYLDSGLALSAATGQPYWDAEIHRIKGEVALRAAEPDVDSAERHHRAAIEIARRQGALMLELRANTALVRLPDRPTASEDRAALAAVVARFSEGADSADLREAQALL